MDPLQAANRLTGEEVPVDLAQRVLDCNELGAPASPIGPLDHLDAELVLDVLLDDRDLGLGDLTEGRQPGTARE
ncbi:hypothetical protein D3C72_1705820 [compost metagenome]